MRSDARFCAKSWLRGWGRCGEWLSPCLHCSAASPPAARPPGPAPLLHVCMHVQVPTAVFSQPPMGTVGLTEAQAVERLAGDIDVFISKFKPMKNTLRWVGLLLGV